MACIYRTPDDLCEKYSRDGVTSFCCYDDPNNCVGYNPPNIDRIRTMNEEELAETITADWCSIVCPGGSFFCDGDCVSKVIAWLKQGVKDG